VRYESDLHQYSYDKLVDLHWEADKNTRRSNAGIHRDDFILSIKEKPARDFGSQGQIKSIIFAMHLSKYKILAVESGFTPVMILDDIFDKLDESRLSRLMEILMHDEFGQILLSDTSNKRVGHRVDHRMLHEIAIQPSESPNLEQ
jgi:DNA replication and repair protein RecF